MSEIEEITPLVLEKSREEKLKWEDAGEDAFYCNIKDMNLTIERTRSGHALTLRNTDGRVIERTSSAAFQEDALSEALAEIYELARRKALRVEDTLQRFKDALQGL